MLPIVYKNSISTWKKIWHKFCNFAFLQQQKKTISTSLSSQPGSSTCRLVHPRRPQLAPLHHRHQHRKLGCHPKREPGESAFKLSTMKSAPLRWNIRLDWAKSCARINTLASLTHRDRTRARTICYFFPHLNMQKTADYGSNNTKNSSLKHDFPIFNYE